jgi:hypothetical protein
MNIINTYDSSLLVLLEPQVVEHDTDTYKCELSYNNKPMLINNLPSCMIDSVIQERYVYLAINKQHALFFDNLYNELIQHIYTNGSEWFEDELTMEEIEASLIHPLKINIRDDVYDLKLKLNERFYCTDSDGNIIVPDLNKLLVNPVIHIRSVIFATKQFYIDIELISCSIESVVETSVETSGETSIETSGETSGETNVETSVETSGETNVETFGETNVETFGETNVETFGETNVETLGETNVETLGETNVETNVEDNISTDELQEGVLPDIIEDDDSIVLDTHADINMLIDTKIRNNIIMYLKTKALSGRKINFNLEEDLFESDYLLNE